MVVPDGIFPCKLHDMLEYAARYNMEHVSIEWTLNGTAFIVNDPDGLMKILPLFFGQTNNWIFIMETKITNDITIFKQSNFKLSYIWSFPF